MKLMEAKDIREWFESYAMDMGDEGGWHIGRQSLQLLCAKLEAEIEAQTVLSADPEPLATLIGVWNTREADDYGRITLELSSVTGLGGNKYLGLASCHPNVRLDGLEGRQKVRVLVLADEEGEARQALSSAPKRRVLWRGKGRIFHMIDAAIYGSKPYTVLDIEGDAIWISDGHVDRDGQLAEIILREADEGRGGRDEAVPGG